MFTSLLAATGLPAYVLISWLFVFGAIFGSFLNVVAYRLHTGKSLKGKSHCLSCTKKLSPLELIPILSYLVIRGRCVGCSSYIPTQYVLVETVTALLFVLAGLFADSFASLVLMVVVSCVLVLVTVYDLKHLIIPDELVVILTVLALVYGGYEIMLGTSYLTFVYDIAAATIASGFFFALWYFSRGAWIGLGDAKLIVPLALLVGHSFAFSLVVLSFWVGSIVGITIIAIQKVAKNVFHKNHILGMRLSLKSAIPFAPFLVIAFFLVIYLQIDVISLLRYE